MNRRIDDITYYSCGSSFSGLYLSNRDTFDAQGWLDQPRQSGTFMQSVRIHSYSQPAIIDDVATPQVAAGQVLIRVQAVALNPLDTLLMSGNGSRFFPIELPYALGLDFAGTIERVADGVDGFEPGDSVIAWADPLTGGGRYQIMPLSLPSNAYCSRPN